MTLPHRDASRDSGVSLIEVVVAMGVFGVLMAIASAFFINAYGGIRDASSLSNVQQQQRNAILRASTAIRFADNATEGRTPTGAVVTATPTTLEFYTRSSMTPTQTSPSRVRLYTSTTAPNEGIVMETTAPGASTPTQSLLVRAEPGQTPSLTFTYLDDSGSSLGAKPAEVAAAATWEARLARILVTIADNPSGLLTEQSVTLVNPR